MKNGDLIGQNDGIMGIEWDTMVDIFGIYRYGRSIRIYQPCQLKRKFMIFQPAEMRMIPTIRGIYNHPIGSIGWFKGKNVYK